MENNLPFMSVACIIGLGYIKLPHSGSVFIPVRPPCSCLVFVNMEGITNHWQEAVSPMINVLFSGSWITHLASLLHWSPGGRIIKDLFWINNMEQQHVPIFPEKRRYGYNTEGEHQTFSHHWLERNEERREMTAAPPQCHRRHHLGSLSHSAVCCLSSLQQRRQHWIALQGPSRASHCWQRGKEISH